MDLKVEDMDGMSQDELMAMEDKAVEDEANGEEVGEVDTPAPEPEPKPDPEPKPKAEEATKPEPDPEHDDITKHVSPPSKWAAQRAAVREAKAAAANAEALATENATLVQQVEWLKSQATAKGVDVDKTPADMLTPEKIASVREEFGDELADMFQAVRATANISNPPVKPEKHDAPVGQKQAPQANDEMEAALDDNDDLSYWRQHSKELWDKAVEVNESFLRDPDYIKLPFNERFYHVAKQVKADALASAKEGAVEQKETTEPPPSLSGAGSPPPTQAEKNIVDDIMAAKPEDQAKMYNSLSESERDKLDMELGI